jgi:hypothetical protein
MEDNGCLRPLEIMGRANTDSIQSKVFSLLNILEVLIYRTRILLSADSSKGDSEEHLSA